MTNKIDFAMEGKPIQFSIPDEFLKKYEAEPRIIFKKYLIGIPVPEKLLTPAAIEQMRKQGFTAVMVPTATLTI